MVGWQTMDTGESWLDGLDWTSVEVGQHASRKAGTGSLSNSLDGFLLPAEEIVAEGRAVVLVNLDAAGLLLVTNFRLLFLGEGAKQLVPLGTIPLATIEKVTKLHLGRSPPASRLPGAAPLRPVRRLLHIVGGDSSYLILHIRM
jgi:myotubularin-related protein 1/2